MKFINKTSVKKYSKYGKTNILPGQSTKNVKDLSDFLSSILNNLGSFLVKLDPTDISLIHKLLDADQEASKFVYVPPEKIKKEEALRIMTVEQQKKMVEFVNREDEIERTINGESNKLAPNGVPISKKTETVVQAASVNMVNGKPVSLSDALAYNKSISKAKPEIRKNPEGSVPGIPEFRVPTKEDKKKAAENMLKGLL